MASRIREMFSSKEDPVYRVNYAQLHGPIPVVELRVPMCCEKCREKVQEELEEVEGVRNVVCDQYNQRVTVTGHVDPLRVLKRAKKVKKKSEFLESTTGPGSTHLQTPRSNIHHPGSPAVPLHRDKVKYTGHSLVHGGGPGSRPGSLMRTNSFGRERGLARQPSYGKVTHYDGLRHHDFENRDLQRDYYGVRRMPSFKKHRYHDAEYVAMGDQFAPQYAEAHYVAPHCVAPHYVARHHNQRGPALQSQVSFTKLPVRNSYYVKPTYYEY